MTEKDLSPRQSRFVAAMLTARTIGEAAQAAGVTERTGKRYLKIPAVKVALGHALDSAMTQATSRAVTAMSEALETLEAIHRDEGTPAPTRVSAARAILQACPKLREAMDLAQRVAEMEERMQRIQPHRRR